MGATHIGTTTALHDVYLFNPDEVVAVGERGLILRKTDAGAGWQSVASGVKNSLRSVSFSGVNGISGGDSQTILYSTDSGASRQIYLNNNVYASSAAGPILPAGWNPVAP